MTPEEFKKTLKEELELIKSNELIAPIEDVNKRFDELRTKYDGVIEGLEATQKEFIDASKKQGVELEKLRTQRDSNHGHKLIIDTLKENKDFFDQVHKEGSVKNRHSMTIKTIDASNFEQNIHGYADPEIGKIAQGYPFMMELLRNRIPVGANNNEGVGYWYEESVTNNAAQLAENAKGTASDFVWKRGTLGWKRTGTHTKLSIYQLNDMAFLAAEARALLQTDFMLHYNDQLINGNGSSTNINGLNSYATEFPFADQDWSGSIAEPDIIDLLNTIQLYMTQESKDKYVADWFVARRAELWKLQTKKDAMGRRIYPETALSGRFPVVNGVNMMTNELKGANKAIQMDSRFTKLYSWDGIEMEIFQTDDDELEKKVTMAINTRSNLLVKPTDVKSVIKVSNVADALAGIEKVGN